MRRLLVVLALLTAAASALPRAARSQATRADFAAILHHASQRLNVEGKRAAADALLDFILRRFGDTPAAALCRLSEPSAAPSSPQERPAMSSRGAKERCVLERACEREGGKGP